MNAPEAEQAAAFHVAFAVREIAEARVPIFLMVFWGVTFVLYGLAKATGTVYPRWLGWVAVVGEVGNVLNGSLIAYGSFFAILIKILPKAARLNPWSCVHHLSLLH